MKQKQISKQKISKPSPSEPNRTRSMYTVKCTRCDAVNTVLKYKPNSYCRACELQLTANTRWLVKIHYRYGDKYTFENTKFVNGSTPVTITCKYHGIFKATPFDLIHASTNVGCCNKCMEYFAKHKNDVPTSVWKDRIYNKVASDVTLITDKAYLRVTDDVSISCKYHGILTIKVSQITNGLLVCPKCGTETNGFNIRYHRTDIPGIVYLMYLPKINKWKLGVTYRDIKRRRTELGGKGNCQIQWTYKTKTLKDAYYIEQYLFTKYADKRYTGPRLIPFGGYTELLNIPLSKLTEGFVEEILRLNEPKTGNSKQIKL